MNLLGSRVRDQPPRIPRMQPRIQPRYPPCTIKLSKIPQTLTGLNAKVYVLSLTSKGINDRDELNRLLSMFDLDLKQSFAGI